MRNVKEKRGIFIMKQKAMDMKLVVKPLVGCLTHTHFWEGPCRAGHKEDMTVEAETKAADEDTISSRNRNTNRQQCLHFRMIKIFFR